MKVYFHLNPSDFSNCYLVVNEKNSEAILIDPGQLNEAMVNQLEDNRYKLSAILITHNHSSSMHGLKTLFKIYSPKIYGADWEIAGGATNLLMGDGKFRIAGMTVRYMTLPGHTADSMLYKLENVLFTGDSISSGLLGTTSSSYSSQILRTNVENKIFSQQDTTVILPGHGPPTTVRAEKLYSRGMQKRMHETLLSPDEQGSR